MRIGTKSDLRSTLFIFLLKTYVTQAAIQKSAGPICHNKVINAQWRRSLTEYQNRNYAQELISFHPYNK